MATTKKERLAALIAAHGRVTSSLAALRDGKVKEVLDGERSRIAWMIDGLGGVLFGDDDDPVDEPDEPISGGGLDGLTRDDLTGGGIDVPGGPPEIRPCVLRALRARASLASRENHWFENWGKNHSFICRRMMFPKSVDELAAAVSWAEVDGVPARAVGGGWSMSDAVVPGRVDSGRRPFALGVEAITQMVPESVEYDEDPERPIVAEVAQPASPPSDGPASLEMFDPSVGENLFHWGYTGNGRWSVGGGEYRPATPYSYAIGIGMYPVNRTGDRPGSLVMFDSGTGRFMPSYFYNGGGVWTVGVLGSNPVRGSWRDLYNASVILPTLRPQACSAAFGMSMLSQPQRAYLINTRSLSSSLQSQLRDILSDEGAAAVDPGTDDAPNPRRKHYFHVEAGITMAELSKLLSHQSPKLAIEASGGSPGATLAGALATATHGGEHQVPLLLDRIKAVHFVGPGGTQWWIEGDDSIADPDKLRRIYPCLERERIITGRAPVEGVRPHDWLTSVIVSLGSMGVAYSMVLEAVPLYGIHEIVVESTWSDFVGRAEYNFRHDVGGHIPRRGYLPVEVNDLRTPPPDETQRIQFGGTLYSVFADGRLTGLTGGRNQYVDIAIDLNPIGGTALRSREWNCWVINREFLEHPPLDPKPYPSDPISRIPDALSRRIEDPATRARLLEILDASFIENILEIVNFDDLHDVPGPGRIVRAAHQIDGLVGKLDRLLSSADTIDAALDLLTEPFSGLRGTRDFEAASAVVSGFFSGLLGVVNGRAESSDVVSKVGAIGFPAAGIMGSAIEIGMHPKDGFPFLQREVLDRVTEPFFGYVSVRMCPQTRSLLGMQQYSPSMMIELVAFATPYARELVASVQERAIEMIRAGELDATLHWGLECEQLDAESLRAIPAFRAGSPSKLERFQMVRRAILAAGPETEGSVFDSAMTERLGL